MKKEEAAAEEILRQLRASGYSYGGMLSIIRLALEKLENLKKIKK